ncbi:MAG TPA: sugar ABC transporter substrate-binding protein [Candidatus Paceibacterota bacterium]|nr:sugar ABC transporter substrate-binding protein [Verrucomicrobiota bacterium]HRY48109.1 sugar ABC transporter substrate-binding protein [Candidatus Paceibacterota bacterium]
MKSHLALFMASLLVLVAGVGCNPSGQVADKQMTIGVSFETLQTEFWVAALDAFKSELSRQNIKMLEAIADGDANRQLEQIRNFITRKVDGIIVVPKDSKTILPMIKTANNAGIPMVLFNRPPDPSEAKSVTIVADNYAITKATVEHMVQRARKIGGKFQAMILIGDLGDMNAIGRRDGFEDVMKQNTDAIEVVARIPTEWNQEKAQAGTVNALQAHPGINFIFASSDFLFPSVISALKSTSKYKKVGEPGHILLGGFDGDATAYQMLKEGYLDADGVQDVYFEAKTAIQAILDLRAGKNVPAQIQDPGFVIHQDNLQEMSPRMWGAQIKK